MAKGLTALLFAALCAWCARAETNVWREAVRRLHVNACADVETAYRARGKIVNDEPPDRRCRRRAEILNRFLER